MNTLLLYSGGMDSFIAWHYLGQPSTLYVDLGHLYRANEIGAIANTIPETKRIVCHTVGRYEKQDAEIPLRNLFLSMFAALEGAEKIWLIVQKDEMTVLDRTEKFLYSSSDMLTQLLGKSIIVDSPFKEMDKTEMVAWYLKNVGDIGALLLTVGCFYERMGHCGNCGACFRRFVAFKNNGISPGYVLSEEIRKYYRERLNKYSVERQERMREWVL